MKKTLSLVAIISVMSISVFASTTIAKSFTKAEIEAMIGDYIVNNGDKVIQGVEKFQKKQKDDRQKNIREKLANSADFINDPSHPSIGPENADVTIVEFFDYNCGYCTRAFHDIQKIAKADKKTRFVFMEMPILGPTSMTASQWSLAAHEQGKYFEYHSELMNHRGPKNEKELIKLANKIGLDVDKMKRDAGSSKIKKAIEKSRRFARDVGVNGTPAFIAGGELMPGYIGEDGLKTKIKSLRGKK